MTEYIVAVDGWTRALEWTDTVPPQMKKWEELGKGSVVDLDPDNPRDAADIERLANVQFRPALVLKEEFDARNREQEAATHALATARAATLTGPTATSPVVALEQGYPEGQRVDSPPTTVGSGGTDPEPQGLIGEQAGDDYDSSDIWSYQDLQVAARERGIAASGARIDLVARLRAFDRTETAPLSRAAANEELDDEDQSRALRNDNKNA